MVWHWLLALFVLVQAAFAQVNTISNPDLVTFNLNPASSATFHLSNQSSTASRHVKYYITLNICGLPSSDAAVSLVDTPVLYAFNSSDTLDPSSAPSAVADRGFANLTVTHSLRSDNGLWIVVSAPALNDTSSSTNNTWSFQLGVSTTEPMHIIDSYARFQYADSGNTSALFTGPTYYPTLDDTLETYLVVLPTADVNVNLSLAYCYISSLSSIIPQSSIQITNTSRGVYTLPPQQGAHGLTLERHLDGGTRDQYYVQGLDVGTNYTVYGMQLTGQTASSDASVSTGKRLFSAQHFVTKTTPNCRLLYEYPTCPSLAYAAVSPPELPTTALYQVYDNLIQPHITNLNTSLSQFPCNVSSENKYSSVRTCTDCLEAYTTWLCAVLVPRCDDVPSDSIAAAEANYSRYADIDTVNQVVFNTEPLQSEVQTRLIRTDPATSRTPQFSAAGLANNTNFSTYDPTPPFPYAEVPPCDSVCHLVAASCPFAINWFCPLRSETLAASYGLMRELHQNDMQGGNEASYGTNKERSADKYGHVFCNSMQTDMLLEVRYNNAGVSIATPRWMLVLSVPMALLLL